LRAPAQQQPWPPPCLPTARAPRPAGRYTLTPGLKFGGDFLAYPGDPECVHAAYVVRVLPPPAPSAPGAGASPGPPAPGGAAPGGAPAAGPAAAAPCPGAAPAWASGLHLAGAARVAAAAKKQLLLATWAAGSGAGSGGRCGAGVGQANSGSADGGGQGGVGAPAQGLGPGGVAYQLVLRGGAAAPFDPPRARG
jgi:hypothetical protein